MNGFRKRTALRIAAVSLVLAAIAAPASWYVAREMSEQTIVALATEESRRLIEHHGAADLAGPDAARSAAAAARSITGGLFDIAEIYDSRGEKLAEATTAEGSAIEPSLPHHGRPGYSVASYETHGLPGAPWVLRVFVPLRGSMAGDSGPTTGYFEGVRVVPQWQRDQVFHTSLAVALMVSFASLLCGAAVYPVVLRLASENERKSREVVETQAALIEALQRSERELEDKVEQRTGELRQEQSRTKELLHNMLPAEIADELAATGAARPARHESATILFTDFARFTEVVSAMPADRMVRELNEIFAAFDDIADACGIEKIKTIGDAYMAAAGLPKPCADHAQRCVRAGLRMVDYIEARNRTSAFKWALRVGVHSGPVVAGVVGKRKYAYDIWGDTVNIASRMESSGEPGRVNVSAYTCDLVRGEFDCEYRGKVDAKGKGRIDMYFVKGAREDAAGEAVERVKGIEPSS